MDVEIIGDIADKMKIIKERENLSIGFVTWSKYENLMISWVQHPPDRYVLPGYSESDAKIPWLNVKAGNIKFYFLQQIEFTFHNNNSPFAPSVCTKNVFEESESCRIWWQMDGSHGMHGGKKAPYFLWASRVVSILPFLLVLCKSGWSLAPLLAARNVAFYWYLRSVTQTLPSISDNYKIKLWCLLECQICIQLSTTLYFTHVHSLCLRMVQENTPWEGEKIKIANASIFGVWAAIYK